MYLRHLDLLHDYKALTEAFDLTPFDKELKCQVHLLKSKCSTEMCVKTHFPSLHLISAIAEVTSYLYGLFNCLFLHSFEHNFVVIKEFIEMRFYLYC